MRESAADGASAHARTEIFLPQGQQHAPQEHVDTPQERRQAAYSASPLLTTWPHRELAARDAPALPRGSTTRRNRLGGRALGVALPPRAPEYAPSAGSGLPRCGAQVVELYAGLATNALCYDHHGFDVAAVAEGLQAQMKASPRSLRASRG